jgi:hypothetical protein
MLADFLAERENLEQAIVTLQRLAARRGRRRGRSAGLDDRGETARQATGKQEQAEGCPSALEPLLPEVRHRPVLLGPRETVSLRVDGSGAASIPSIVQLSPPGTWTDNPMPVTSFTFAPVPTTVGLVRGISTSTKLELAGKVAE